jgi:uncharacterized SAM-binding protein YcdF (DUF218 family)
VSELISFFFSVGGIVLCLVVGTVWLIARPAARGPRRWLAGVALFYAVATTPLAARLASLPLVAGLTPLSVHAYRSKIDTIVLLGASSRLLNTSNGEISVLTVTEASRVLEAARVYHGLDNAWIISSGGRTDGSSMPEAIVMRNALRTLGVPEDRILLEASSKTTRDEAILLAPVLRSRRAERFILVTSDVHMPRSLAAFRAEGLDPVPARATYPLDLEPIWRGFIPRRQSFEFFSEIAHEYAGLAYYGVRGWLRFDPPAPSPPN